VVHINDVLYCLKNVSEKGKVGERYIVAGENLYLKDVFEMIAEVAGVEAPRFTLPRWALHLLGGLGDHVLTPLGLKSPLSRETAWTSTLYHWFSSEKAQKELGLQVTPAKLAIRDSVEWMKKNGYLS
jgi:dihydroflavonol-4-reductase